MDSVLQKIANALLQDEDDEQEIPNFYACEELLPTDLNVEFKDVGHLIYPLTHESIEKLISISFKAKFGLREQTLLDENVRNTQEIKPDQFNVTAVESSMSHMLSKMRDHLGLPENSVLIPYLHNMLIYGPGQFFNMHQDTEKLKNMIATLVIVLPSSHIGGNLIIQHGQRDYTFSSENLFAQNLKCIAFYSDCKHKVENVKEGYRVALTYNLVLKSETASSIKNTNEQLKNAVAEYFAVEPKDTKKLVYFFNHSYTEHGLSWYMLKGEDRTNVSAIESVAKQLSLIPHLALVKIQQTYSTYGDEYDDSDPEIGEHEGDDFTLTYWIDKENKKLPYGGCNVSENEICLTKETKKFEPYEKEYEGYQGNYGGNMEYWYRRAAIVLWPESSQIAMNFMLNYENALTDLITLTNIPGNEEKVSEIISSAVTHLIKPYHDYQEHEFVKFVNIALYVKNAILATSVLSQFKWKILNSGISESLAKLQAQYGCEWVVELLNKWKNNNVCLLNNIDSSLRNFLVHKIAGQVAELLLGVQFDNLIGPSSNSFSYFSSIYYSKSIKMEQLYQFFTACSIIQNTELLNKMLGYVETKPDIYPVFELVGLFVKLRENIQPAEFITHFDTLKSYLMQAIEKKLALAMHDENDWSITTKLRCDCKHCFVVNSFLRSKTQIKTAIPAVTAVRKHFMSKLKSSNLLFVDVTVEARGSPHKLVLVKNALLHENAQKNIQ